MTAELDKRALEAAARAIIRGRASVGDNLGPPLTGKILERYVDHSWRLWLEDANHAVEAYLAARQDATADVEFTPELFTPGPFGTPKLFAGEPHEPKRKGE